LDARAEPLANGRLRILARASFIWGFLILARLVSLQIFRHDEYQKLAQQQQDREVEIQAPRGIIFDRMGRPLAMSLPVDSVCINPLRVPDLALAADLLSRVLEVDGDVLLGKMASAVDNHRGFMWVKRKITPEESAKLRSYNLDWVEFRTESRRFYPKDTVGANLLGGVDHVEKGNAGVELSLNEELEGKPGVMRTTSDVKQRVVDLQIFTDPQPGKDVTLSIDERIQHVAEHELALGVARTHAKTGSLVVMDPKTGEVLAMASYPSFDPNIPPVPGQTLETRTNLPVSSPFEPGSVFKVITLSAALETTNIRPGTIINCGGGKMTLFKRVIHDHHSYSSLSMADVLAKSSNIGAINIGLRVGEANLYEYVKRFGFGKSTGIPLPGESSGRLRPLRKWIASSIGSIAMGHELSATTLQLAQACSVIANGGMLVKPRLTLKRQRPGDHSAVLEPTVAPVRVLQPETAITMRQMMEGVVLHGTGTKARLDGYTSGGKTGTAQIFDFKTHSYTHKYNSSFMGFAPLNNPAIVIVATLNGTALMGAEASAPVFKGVATAALRFLDVPKDLPDFVAKPDDGKTPADDLAIANLGGNGNPLDDDEQPAQMAGIGAAATAAQQLPAVPGVAMEIPPVLSKAAVVTGPRAPDFAGKTLRDVLEQSAALGIQVEFTGSGLAAAQQPAPGTPLRQGERIRVQFAR
jgi:cell division protein FtsI (penicillin-binding protein 3)